MTVYANKPAFNIREKLKELDKPIGTLAYQDASAPIINSLMITDNTSSVAAAFPNPMLLLRGQYPYLVFQDTDTVTPGSTSTLHGHQSGTIYYDANNPNSAGISGGHSFRINGATQTIMLLNTDGMDLPSGRIKFPATQNASGDANTLDDYEEGTWTPALVASSGTYSYQAGRYTKIGNLVTLEWQMTLTGKSGGIEFGINGLPFAPATAYQCSMVGIGHTYGSAGVVPTAIAQQINFVSVESSGAMYFRASGGTNASFTMADINSTGSFTGSVTYIVA